MATTTVSNRPLGLSAVTFISIGFMIGGGVFVFTGIVLNITGKALPLAYALAAIPVFISMLPLAMLGAAIPTTGGNYKYPSRLVSPLLAFTGVWVYALASFFGQIPLYAICCVNYAGFYFSVSSPHLAAATIVTAFYIVNLLGVRIAAIFQGLLVILLLSALMLYAYRGISIMPPDAVSAMFDLTESNLFLGMALLSFTYFGANGIIELGEDIRNPGKVIPRSFAIAFAAVAVIYVAMAVGTVGSVPLERIMGQREPLIAVSRFIMTPAETAYFVYVGAVLAIITTLNALFIVGTKSLLIIVQDGLLPEFLAATSKRFGTHYYLLTFIWAAGVIGIFSGLELETLASYAALGGLMVFLPVQIASLRLPRVYPEKYRTSPFKLKGFFFWFCPVVAALVAVFFCLAILADMKSPWKVAVFVIFIFSGAAFFLARKRWLAGKGIRLDDEIRRKSFGDFND